MSTPILPRRPKTRKSASDNWLNERIGQRNGRRHESGPQYMPRILSDEEREAQGYVKCWQPGGGFHWQKCEYTTVLDWYGPEGDAARLELRQRIAELDAEQEDRYRCGICHRAECSH